MANVSSNNLTSLYGGGSSTVLPTTPVPVVDSSIASKNLTTLYSGAGAPVIPTSPYGNANVERFLNAGTDGGNTVTNINMAGDLNVGGISNLGNVGNVHITGGTLNYVLQTDGAGNLSWTEQIGANTVNGSEYIHFDVVSNGNNQTFSNSNIALFASNVNMNVMKNGVNIEPTLYEKTGNITIQVNIPLNTGDTIDILAAAGGGGGAGTPGGNITQVQYNGGGVFSGNTSFTFDQPNSLMSVGNINSGKVSLSGGSNTTSVTRQFAPNSVSFSTNFSNVTTYDLVTIYHPNASTGYPGDRVVRSRGNSTTPTTAVSGDRIYQKAGYVYNGATNVASVVETFTTTGGVNANANAVYTGGQWNILTGNPQGDTSNVNATSSQNQLIFTNSGSLQINPGTAPNSASLGQSESAILIQSWGRSTTNLAGAGGINSQKARGNRDVALSVQPLDELGRWNIWGYNGTSYQSGNAAAFVAEVASDYVANASIIPINMRIRAVSNTAAAKNTYFYGNGTVEFPGNIVSPGTANVVNINVSGISNLGANGNVIITGGNSGQALVTDGSGNLSWGNVANSANANYANFAGTAFTVAGANVTGFVPNASYANYANIAFSVSGSNVSGTVASATVAASANSVNVANVVGIGNIAVINLNGNANSVLAGNGGWIPQVGGSGNGVPAGPTGAVQINGGLGAFSNVTGFTADPSGLSVTGNVTVTGNLFANNSMVANTYTYTPNTYTQNLIIWTSNSNTTVAFGVNGGNSNTSVSGNLNVTGNILHQTGTANLNNLVVIGTSTFNNTVTYNAPIVGLPSISIDSFDDGGVYTRSLDVLTRQVSYDTTPFATNHPLTVGATNMQIGSSANLQYIFLNGAANTYYMTPITYPGVTANVHWSSGSAPSTGVANKWNVYSFNVICTAANTVEIFASTSTY